MYAFWFSFAEWCAATVVGWPWRAGAMWPMCLVVGQGDCSESESEGGEEEPEPADEDEVGAARRSGFISVLRMLCAVRKRGEYEYVGGVLVTLGREMVFRI